MPIRAARRPTASTYSHPRCEPLESRRLLSAGDLDPTFGGDGTVAMDVPGSLNDRALAIAVQNDGRIVVASSSEQHMAVTRYLPNGSLDTSFGAGGTARLSFGQTVETPGGVVVDGLGRIVVAGSARPPQSTPGDFAVARLTPAGTPDTSFDGDGLALVDFGGGNDGAVGLAIRPDNSIVLGGSSSGSFALAALRENGALDPSFGGGDGQVVTASAAPRLEPSDMVVDSAGRIVIGGTVFSASGQESFALARYLADGTPDNSFDGDGQVSAGPSYGYLYALAAAPGGKVVAAGVSSDTIAFLDRQMVAVRYNEDGSLDASFGGSGIVAIDFGSNYNVVYDDVASAVAVDPADGAVLLAGSSITSSRVFGTVRQQSAVARLTSAGARDATFTGDGIDLGRDGDFNAVAVLPNGVVFAAGSTPVGTMYSSRDILLSKYVRTGRDTTFGSGGGGTGGSVSTDLRGPVDNVGRAVAVQGDGKVLVGGSSGTATDTVDFAISRFNADGTPDLAFGGGTGYVVLDSPRADQLNALALQGDGKILAAGYATDIGDGKDLLLVRYLSDGTLDRSFGGGTGRVTLPLVDGQNGYATSMALQPDGKVVVAGAKEHFAAFVTFRFDASGALDTTFGGGDGVVVTPIGNDFARAVVIDAAGRIVVAGGASATVVARYDPSGNLDTTFDADGLATFQYSPVAGATSFTAALGVDASNRIVVAGRSTEGTAPNAAADFGVARLREDGSLDPEFGTGGRTVTDFSGGWDEANGLVVLPDGSVIVAGSSLPGTAAGVQFDFALARYTSAGVLDPSFGSGGKVTTDFGARDEGRAVALDGADRVVVAGRSGGDFAAARYLLTVGEAAPRVLAATVSGSAWLPAFRNYLRDTGLSADVSGYPVGSAAGGPLPWINLNQVSVTFDQQVQVGPNDLRVRGAGGTDYALDPAAFSYDAATRIATWRLASGAEFGADRVRLELDDDAVRGGGRQLDGDGDGTAGGDFAARFDVLPGDATRDGIVLADDYSAVKKKFFTGTTTPFSGDRIYSVFHDVNGNGTILANDFSEVKKRFFLALPPGESAAAALAVRRVAEGLL